MGVFAPPQGAWLSWVPTWTNLTIGNGTQTAKYWQDGKMVTYKLDLVFGTTTTMGTNPNFTFPVTAAAGVGIATTQPLGILRLFDVSASASYTGYCYFNTTTTAVIQYHSVSGTTISSGGPTSTTPFTWASTDEIHVSGSYEAA